MQTHYKQLTDSQWQIMKTSLPIQSAPKVQGTPLAWGRDALGMGKDSFGKKKKTRSIPQVPRTPPHPEGPMPKASPRKKKKVLLFKIYSHG